MKNLKPILILFLLSLTLFSLPVLGAEKPFIVSSVMSSDKEGLNSTNVFSSEHSEVFWKGTVKKVGMFDKETIAEWYSPDGKLYRTKQVIFDATTNTGSISLSLGDTPWSRVQTGQWVLNIKRKGYQGISESFIVEPSIPPENFKDLYINLKPNYEKFFIECAMNLSTEDTILSSCKFTDFKGSIYLQSSYFYENQFNDIRTNPQSRASTLIVGALLKASKLLYKHFGESTDLEGYILEISSYHYNFVSKTPPVLEVVKLIIKPADIKKYIDLETTAQELIKSSIVIINDERIELTLQPI